MTITVHGSHGAGHAVLCARAIATRSDPATDTLVFTTPDQPRPSPISIQR